MLLELNEDMPYFTSHTLWRPKAARRVALRLFVAEMIQFNLRLPVSRIGSAKVIHLVAFWMFYSNKKIRLLSQTKELNIWYDIYQAHKIFSFMFKS